MATLPDVGAQTQQTVPQPSGGVAAYEAVNWRQVGMAGDTIARGGRDLEDASTLVAATNERQDAINAQAAGNALAQQRINLEFNQDTGFRNAKEGQAVGQQFVDDYGTKFNDAASNIRDSLANDNQKRMFDQQTQVQSLQYKSALLTHQAQETEKFNDSTANSTLDTALRTMAQKPTDELNFQTGLAQINGTLDSVGKRKGYSDVQVADLKSKYLDAAYSTRITSINNGIPGVAEANPYGAEKMFMQVQDQLGPASQIHLSGLIEKSVEDIQQRDGSKGFIFGGVPLSPKAITPAVTGAPLAAVVMSLESGGKDTDANGNPLTSSKGAVGRMQIMPATATAPGFGVRPAQVGPDGKISPDEMARVATDYLGAMTARYNNPALILAAYNAGPGQVDKWISQFGDPRTGAISTTDWASKIPFDETKNYVTNGLGKLGPMPAQNTPAPTAKQLQVDLPSRIQAARDWAEQVHPGNPAFADGVAARVENLGRMVISNYQGLQAGSRDTLFQGLVGNPDGSNKPQTIDQLLANPDMKRAWNQATPETQLAIQSHFKNGGGDPARTADTQAILYQYMGKASNDREGFANEDLSPLIATLPHADFDKLSNMQFAARNKQELDQEKATNFQHALGLLNSYHVLDTAKIQKPDKNSGDTINNTYNNYTGRLAEALDNFKAVNGKRPDDSQILALGKSLTASVQVPGNWLGKYSPNIKLGVNLTPEEEATAVPKMTQAEKDDATNVMLSRYGFKPTDSMLQQYQLNVTLHPNDPKVMQQFDQTMRMYGARQNTRQVAGKVTPP